MVRTVVLGAALAAGAFAVAPSAASAAPASVGVTLGAAHAKIMPVDYYRRGGWGYRSGWGYRRGPAWGYRGYRRAPAVGFYVAPARPVYYKRCWIDRYGYRVCR